MSNKGAGRKDMKQMIRKLRKAGATIVLSGGGHYQATHPGKPGVTVTFPCTTSDWRGLRNTKAMFKRQLGIEI